MKINHHEVMILTEMKINSMNYSPGLHTRMKSLRSPWGDLSWPKNETQLRRTVHSSMTATSHTWLFTFEIIKTKQN